MGTFFGGVVNIGLAKIVLRVVDDLSLGKKVMKNAWWIGEGLRLGSVGLPVRYDNFLVIVWVFLDVDLEMIWVMEGFVFWCYK